MAQLVVNDLDDDVIRRLAKRAAAHGRSVEAEHRAIIEEAVRKPAQPPIEVARRFLRELQPGRSDSTEIIRELREGRFPGDC